MTDDIDYVYVVRETDLSSTTDILRRVFDDKVLAEEYADQLTGAYVDPVRLTMHPAELTE